MSDPRYDAMWTSAKKASPSRTPYTDEELKRLRIQYEPRRADTKPVQEVTVIWTLLDMLEEQRGWTL